MKIALLGFDVEGQAAYEYWNQPGNKITICDMDPAKVVPEGAHSQLGDNYLNNLDHFDLLVRTPGLHPHNIVAANSPAILDKVTTVTNEFLRVCPTKNVIGVTGTKGKGTTSTLIAKMLEAAGKTVHLGGNIGIAPLALLKNNIESNHWVVLEQSSFQLIDIKYSPRIGVCLMIVPEHLNWHADFAEYVDAKRQLFARQTTEDLMVYNAANPHSVDIASSSNAQKLWYKVPPVESQSGEVIDDTLAKNGATVVDDHIYMAGVEICNVDEIALLGRHNWENICAAIAAVWFMIGYDRQAVRSVVTTFKGLPHRLELVRELDGMKYYNDSFAATPDAAMAALDAIPGNKVVIMGGFDRMLSIDHLIAKLIQHAEDIRTLIFIGASAPRLAQACLANDFRNFHVLPDTNMQEVVEKARKFAQPDDTILLSPGFASFDMFKNFEDRGNQYRDMVNGL